MACRFPGSPDLAAFWQLLRSGRSAVTSGRPGAEHAEDPACPWGAFLDGIDSFDAEFFRIAPVEARLMDPQQRLLLETSWQALEDAGIDPSGLEGSRTGVFAGASSNDYGGLIAGNGPASATLYAATGNSLSTAIGRIAFTLGLQGPAIAVDTASSSSLVAVHQAVVSLQSGEADMALAGGVNALLSPVLTRAFWDAGMLAADGRCKTFDAAADGYVRGEGCGVVVLKRLVDAEADGDRIWGVIRGSAVNQDGTSPGLTAPSGGAQERVIQAALAQACLHPSDIDYLEAHGTGTQLGDPTEMRAAGNVYGRGRELARPLLVGSVKTNIGHLESAAGVAGLIKVILSIGFGTIPRHLNFRTPNPGIDWERLPVRVTSQAVAWPRATARPVRAGVSSFGFSGTNAHVVVESHGVPSTGSPGATRTVWDLGAARHVEVPPRESISASPSTCDVVRSRPARVLPLSGKAAAAIPELAARYLRWLEARSKTLSFGEPASDEDRESAAALLADMAWTAGTGRGHFRHRAGVAFGDVAALRRKLTQLASGDGPGGRIATKVAFLFTGQGSQWSGMGRDLYDSEPVARGILDRCERVMLDLRGTSLLSVMFGGEEAAGDLHDTAWTQPSLYALECALAALWESVGIRPSAVVGHSVGDIAAAYVAGAVSLENGLRFAAARGELMAGLPTEGPLAGAMAAVFAPTQRVASAISETEARTDGVGLSVAAENGTHRVVSGPARLVDALTERLLSEGVRVERLNTSHAFHSGLMDPVLDALEAALAEVPFAGTTVPLISNITGRELAPGTELDRGYWRTQAREPVAFADCVAELARIGADVVVELGPRAVLGPLVELAWPNAGGEGSPPVPVTVASLRSPASGPAGSEQGGNGFPDAVGALYEAGAELDFRGLFAGERRRRISLPTYPFQRRSFWIGPQSRPRGQPYPLLGRRRDSADGQTSFETEMSAAFPKWMGDHRVFGRPVAPAALHGALAISAASSVLGSSSVTVEGFRLLAPLVFREAGPGAPEDSFRTVQVIVSESAGGPSSTVKVFSRGPDEDGWTLHGEGRACEGAPAASPSQRVDPAAIRDRLSKESAAALYSALAESELVCGAAFQSVEAVCREGAAAVGEVALGRDESGGGLAVHPALLEACMQVVRAAEPLASESGSTYLPLGWDRLRLPVPLPDRMLCHARLRQGGGFDGGAVRGESSTAREGSAHEPSGRHVVADLRLYGSDGVLIGEMTGLTMQRAAREALLAGSEAVDELLYEVDWVERTFEGGVRPADLLVGPTALTQRVGNSQAYLDAEGVRAEQLAACLDGLERLAKAYALAALERLGWKRARGASVQTSELRRRLKVVSGHERLLGRILELLAEASVLEPDPNGPGWVIAAESKESASGQFLQEAGALAEELAERHPFGAGELSLLRRCGEALADVLRGRSDPRDLLFSSRGTSVADLHRVAPAMRAASRMTADAIAGAVELPQGRRLRVLEVAGGTGGTTEWVLPALPEGQFDYVFTNPSAAFLAEAENRLARSGAAIEFGVLDLKSEPGTQGFEVHGYDLVIAANGLHATRDLGAALRHCRSLLSPSGLLVALDRFESPGWLDLTLGLLESWWEFADSYRPNHPLAGESAWRVALSDAGFGEVAVLGGGESAPRDLAGQSVIIARGPAKVTDPAGVWVLVSDRDGEASELARRLVSRNQQVLVADEGSSDGSGEADEPAVKRVSIDRRKPEAWRSLLASAPSGAPLQGVVHLVALDGCGPNPSTPEMAADISRSGATALALAQALSDQIAPPVNGLWIVTRGAQILQQEPGSDLAGAALWGLGRTLALENPGLRPRMIDLDPDGRVGVAGLVEELLYPDRETLLAFRAGRRLAARLIRSDTRRRLVPPAQSAGRCREDGTYLITGDLAGRALDLAAWLAGRGARSIVLAGSPEPGPVASEAIDALRARQVAVTLVVADVSSPDAIDGILARIDAELPPLAGVVHDCRGRADGVVANQTWERFERVLRPQALAAWHLHRATLDRDLDLFLLCSGAEGTLGQAGRANQAAAAAFLDQLARHRRAVGAAGLAVGWGAWSAPDSPDETTRSGDARGGDAGLRITPRQATGALDRLLRLDMAAGLAGSANWSRLANGSAGSPMLEKLLPASESARPGRPGQPSDPLSNLAREPLAQREAKLAAFLGTELQSILRLPSAPDPTAGFFELGMDSLMAVELTRRLNRTLGDVYTVASSAIFNYTGTAALARHLAERIGTSGEAREEPVRRPSHGPRADATAVVGMACRFPGAEGLSNFWRLLESGANAVTNGRGQPGALDRRSGEAGLPDIGPDWGCFLDGIDRFDAEFFRIAPVEARLMDPQQRLLLETSWAALEEAGIDPSVLRGSRTGVFAGLFSSDYRELIAQSRGDSERLYAATGNTASAAIGRVAFALGLEGPAVAVDTACSSSLVAVHHAVSALERGEADLALAGGANAILSPVLTRAFTDGGMLAPDGQCKTFDAAADGYVRGEGCGIVVLKRLREAEADGDRILAVIRGSAVNQDGASAGLTVPNGPAQERVIAQALERGGIGPSEVDYLEAHGTGTELGDPIEVHAAAAAYGRSRQANRPLLIGSVKTNIGHLEAAAGIAGLIKVVLAMRHGVIPKHLNFSRPSPRIDWDHIPVRVTSAKTPWPASSGGIARAGVSSFGFSGTNAHVVLEAYESVEGALPSDSRLLPGPEASPDADTSASSARTDGPAARGGARATRLLPLSGKSNDAVRELAGRYLAWLDESCGAEGDRGDGSGVRARNQSTLADMAWTAAIGRSHFRHRAGMVFADGEELRRKLAELAAGGEGPGARGAPRVAFVFTGQGSQWAGMGLDLYESEPVVRSVLDRCDAVMRELRDTSLLAVMFGEADGGQGLDDTAWTQPALYALQCALVELWASLGVRPETLLGHSVGEIAAARAAGVFGLEQGLRFAAARGSLMGRLPTEGPGAGAMAAVFASASAVAAAVAESNAGRHAVPLSVAADNGSHQVVSGPADAVSAITGRFKAQGVRCRRLNTGHAFHSALMDPVLDELEAALDGVEPQSPAVTLLSNVTGRPVGSGQALDGAYWRRHAREPVKFADGVAGMAGSGTDVLVEIGPDQVLGPMAELSWPDGSAVPAVLASQRRPMGDTASDGTRSFLEAVASVYEAGGDIAFKGLFLQERRRRVSLPTYPFQRRRHWIEVAGGPTPVRGHPLLGERRDSAGGEITFERHLSASDPAWLADHRVFGRVVVPAALHGKLATAAASELGLVPAVHDLRLRSALVFEEAEEDRPRRAQVVLGPPGDGGARALSIYSKGPDEEIWTLHAEGRIPSREAGESATESADLEGLKAGLSLTDIEEFYEAFSAGEIEYGSAFRRVQAVWSGPGEALGEVTLAQEVEAGGSEADVSLLDGCFQVVLAAAREHGLDPTATYLPIGFEQLQLYSSLPNKVVSHVLLRPAGSRDPDARPGALTSDLLLYDPDGLAIGHARGFAWKLAPKAALLAAASGVGELVYEIAWRERPLTTGLRTASFLAGPSAVRERLSDSASPAGADGAHADDLAALQSGLEALSRSYALATLRTLGWQPQPGAAVDPERLRPQLKVVSEYRPLLKRLFAMVAADGMLEPASGRAGGWVVAQGAVEQAGSPDRVAETLLERHPYGAPELELLARCAAALPDVMLGRTDPVALLYGAEQRGLAELWRNSLAARTANRMVKDTIGVLAADLPGERRLRVLEVGAGTGGTTRAVAASLDRERLAYVATDASAILLDEAERSAEGLDAEVEFRKLDIEAEPVEQGFDPHGFDLIVATHALSAIRDPGETLRHCRDLLAPSGHLIALDGLRGQTWPDLVMGLLPEWWRFADGDRADPRPADEQAWRRLLADAGFGEAVVMPAGLRGDGPAAPWSFVVAQGPDAVVEPPGTWVLASDGQGVAAGLASLLAKRNQTVVVAGEEFAAAEPTSDGLGIAGSYVDPVRREAWKGLFESIPEDPPLRGVVHLPALGTDSPPDTPECLARDVARAGASALALVQGMLDAERVPSKGLWFVSRGAQVLDGGGQPLLAGAALWGFARTVAREAGQLQPRMIDLDPSEPGRPALIVDELLHPDAETQVAYRRGGRHAVRFVRSGSATARTQTSGPPLDGKVDSETRSASTPRTSPKTPNTDAGRLRRDRTYLVTGGLGGIGREIANWLADRGAGAIVLNGRRAPSQQASAVIRSLRKRGVDVREELADVTDPSAVEAMLDRMDTDMPPLAGVIHSVGAWSDASLANQSWERFERVIMPKVLGAWNLHQATAGRDLSMFVLFSSVAGLLGNPGQANYAAANACLDHLALCRRAEGLPGQSIAWGPWSGVGRAEERRASVAGQMAAAGIGWISPRQGLGALDRVVRQDVAAAVVAPLDWSEYAAGLAAAAPHLEEVLPAAPRRLPGQRGTSADLLPRLRRATDERRRPLLESFLQAELQAVLRLPSLPEPTVGFFDLGMDSLMAVELRNRLNRAFSGEFALTNTAVFDFPSVRGLAGHLDGLLGTAGEAAEPVGPRGREVSGPGPIAIVGMACRFPGGSGLEEFWEGLEAGRDAVTDGRPDSGEGVGIDFFREPSRRDPNGDWASYVQGIDRFDAEFFRIAPVEARLMDPQQRLLLEISWQALEDAGIDPGKLRGSGAGVFAGLMNSDYRDLVAASGGASPGLYVAAGNHDSAAIGRISFTLGLEGPAMAVDTACSSSLVAVHQAAAALQRGETNLALAGGANAILTPVTTATYADAGMLAPDGRCKTFDASADGYGRGEGCGMLVLKRLRDAESDGDRIWGVIRGSAVNQDGASAGLTVPNGPAQERVISEALARAGLQPSEVDYLEAHGTGTQLGDPIEVRAAAAVYGRGRPVGRPLLIGSVKTNIGHLESAAGVAGLVKVLLAMNRGLIPKHLHLREPSPRIEWEHLPVQVTSEPTPWPSSPGRPPRAGVSSFGFSGTNAHVLVEGYGERNGDPGATPAGVGRPVPAPGADVAHAMRPRTVRMLPLSAQSDRSVQELAGRYLAWVEERIDDAPPSGTVAEGDSGENASSLLADMAWTAGAGRSHFDRRLGVVFSGTRELRKKLSNLARVGAAQAGRSGARVAFLFTGQGSQWPGMGRDLYECEPVVRAVLDRCDETMLEIRGASLLDVMFGRAGATGSLDDTAWTQPALFALESALCELWASVGIRPAAVLGHSAGELAAARAAGVFEMDDGLRFAAARGALMAGLPTNGSGAGAMAAVFAPAERVCEAIGNLGSKWGGHGLSVAADNGTHQVVSGPAEGVAAVVERLEAEGVRCRQLNTSHAFHSSLMDPILDELEAALDRIEARAPEVPLICNLTGRAMRDGEVADGAYWRRHAREPVAFKDSVAALAECDVDVVVEIGPMPVLGPLAELTWPARGGPAGTSDGDGIATRRDSRPTVLTSMARPAEGESESAGPAHFLEAVAGVYEAGAALDFRGLFAGESRRRISLPNYAFQRRRFWVDPPRRRSGGHPQLGVRRDLPGGEVTFECEIVASDPTWLGDHRVYGFVVVPAAMHAILALEAASLAFRGRRAIVEDLRLHAPLIIPDAATDSAAGLPGRTVQVVVGRPDASPERSVEVFSRGGEGEEWTLHAEARALVATEGAAVGERIDLESVLNRLATADVPEFYHRMKDSRIDYGQAFQVLDGLRSGAGEALGEVALPQLDQDPATVHPVVLDGCFQVAAALGISDDSTYLPISIERLRLASLLPGEFLCHARLRSDGSAAERPTDVLSVDLQLLAPDGADLGEVSGLVLKRATEEALLASEETVDHLLYDVEWRERPHAGGTRSADFLADPTAISQAVKGLAANLVSEGVDRDRLAQLSTDLERLSRSYALAAMRSLGWKPLPGAVEEAAGLRRRLKVVADHGQLFSRILGILAEAGKLLPESGGTGAWTVASAESLSDASLADPERLAEDLIRSHPYAGCELRLLALCGAALPDVLRGRADPLGLLFGSEEAGASDLYWRSPALRAANKLVGDAVAAAVAELPPERKLRVLEIGAGTGSATSEVLAVLPAGRFEYAFTDISAGFFSEAEERFGQDHPSIEYRILDIESDPVEQGFPGHGYDLVIAANVLHATRDLGVTLAHCQDLLAPGGELVALEGFRPQAWLDLTFGLLDGWWRFADRYRPEAALAGEAVWCQALADAGLVEVAALGDADQGVILARAPAEVTEKPGVWLLAAGSAGNATELAGLLAARNQRVLIAGEAAAGTIAPDEDAGIAATCLDPRRSEAWRALLDGMPKDVPLRGVVHLAALDGCGTQATTTEMAEDVARLSATALALLQGLLDGGTVPANGVWFLTRGGQVVERERAGGLAGATLWGLGKTAALEAGELQPRMIDLDPGEPGAFAGLVQELMYPSRETHVAYRDGARHAARVVPCGADSGRLRLPRQPGWRLDRDRGGALDRLVVEAAEPQGPDREEVRLAVLTVGLNFYDVFFAMGIIDGAGLLGAEACGRVVSAGPGVEGVAVGDLVTGFAVGAFAPEVVTRAELVAPVPPAMSAAAAATVPAAFVTADLAFEEAGLKRGDRVLVHAGSGGVGQAAIQLARAAGAEVFATASAPKQAYLRALGVSQVFDSRSPEFGQRILDATDGAGVDLVLNSLTGEGFIESSLACLRSEGWFVELSKRGIWSSEEMGAARPDVHYRVLALDRLIVDDPPRVGASLRGVMARVAAGELQPLDYSAWPLAKAGAAMEFMRAARHRGKIVLAMPRLAAGRLREDGTYLITGGLGGIGPMVAGWLADQGARSIVLNGRREPEPAAIAAIEALRERGVNVRVELADVTDPAATNTMLERIRATLPPLAGVVHSVGVLSDGSLANQSWNRFERVLWPKILGAWHLHRATAHLELDLFVMFSSVTGVVGNPGQANHAAANAFLDQLARHRRAMGLAGQSIAWGAWSELGEAEQQRARIEERLGSLGAGWITPQQGLRALDELVRRDVPTGLAARVDWQVLANRADIPLPMLEEVASGAAARPDRTRLARGELSARLREVPAAERRALLESFLRQELRAVLRLPSPPEPRAGFFDLGMDSLMAVELRNRLNRALAGAYVAPGTVVFDYPDAASLALHLAAELGREFGAGPTAGEGPPERRADDSSEGEAERIESLADEQFLAEAMAALEDGGGGKPQ